MEEKLKDILDAELNEACKNADVPIENIYKILDMIETRRDVSIFCVGLSLGNHVSLDKAEKLIAYFSRRFLK